MSSIPAAKNGRPVVGKDVWNMTDDYNEALHRCARGVARYSVPADVRGGIRESVLDCSAATAIRFIIPIMDRGARVALYQNIDGTFDYSVFSQQEWVVMCGKNFDLSEIIIHVVRELYYLVREEKGIEWQLL